LVIFAVNVIFYCIKKDSVLSALVHVFVYQDLLSVINYRYIHIWNQIEPDQKPINADR